MYGSRKGHKYHGKGKKEKSAAKRRVQAAKGGRRPWKPAVIFCMALVIGGVSLVLAVQALAASGGLRVYEGMGGKGGDTGKRQDIQQRDTASGNIVSDPATGSENTEKEGTEPGTPVPETADSDTSGGTLIVIGAGSSGADGGDAADGREEGNMAAVREEDINLAVAGKVKNHLESMDYRVLLIGGGDKGPADPAGLVTENGAGAYVGICQGFSADQTVKGMEAYYSSAGDENSKRLAQVVLQQAVKRTEAVEREVQADYGGFAAGSISVPACLIKTGYLSNGEERGKLETEEYIEQAAEGIAQGIDYFFHPKTMYLTFDDGPTEENTSRVLDILKERNIKATFFVVGENVRRNPEVARRIVEEGHTVGIHCDNHAYDVVYESVDSYLKDFETAYETVKEVTGVEVKLFRFPGGSVNAYNQAIREELIEEMTGRGFIYFDWNASLEDAVRKSTPEQLIANAVESTLGRKKVVMLAHDIIYDTGMCLEDLLDRLPEYRMEVLTEDVEPVQF